MKHRNASILGFVCLALVLGCQQAEDPVDQPLEIAFEKYTLDNGLDVVLHRDSSDPIVALATLVHVGSSREKPGKTGFAHFFEHMSFNDSENVPRGANRKMIGELGGERNGGTWTDGTVYYEVVPKDAFEKLLWIDSDRLGYMISTVTERALENEKQVVKNEKRQRVDNRPYGHTRAVISQYLYPDDHPYHWPVIGSLADLQAATLEDVREFYDQYYGPNNATLVIAGDIDFAETKALVGRWFGEIERGPEAPPRSAMPVTLEETISIYHVDNFAKLPEIRMVFPTVEEYHPDSYALDALGSILSQGKRAPLYRVIVEQKKLAPGVGAFNSSDELAGTFSIRVRANEGVNLNEVKAAIEEALVGFEENGFSDKDLARIKAEQETAFYDGISSVLGKAFQLAIYNEFTGDPGFVTEDIRRLKAVTREDVMTAYNRYIKDRHYVMTSFVAQGGDELIVDGAVKAEIVEEKIVQGAEKVVEADPDFEYEKTKTEHDRSEPPLGSTPLLTFPEIWTATTDNGIRILGIERDEIPLVEFSVTLTGGQWLDDPAKVGVAQLVSQLMTEGTKSRSPEELEDAIGELGADIRMFTGREQTTIRATTLARNYGQVVALVEEMLLEPRWDSEEFARLKRQALTQIKQREGDPNSIASIAFAKMIYGDDHIFGQPVSGTEESVGGITLEDLKNYYSKYFSPSVAAFHVAGDVERERVMESLAGLASRWESESFEFPSYPTPEPPSEPVVYFIDVPGSKQSVITIGALALAGSDESYNRLVFTNNRLGEGSSARLFQLLRIEKGYTYGASSFVPRSIAVAPFVARSSVRANVTLESLELFKDQLQRYRKTFTDEDLQTTKNLRLKQATREFETLGDLIGVLENVSKFDLPTNYIERDQQEMMGLTLEQVHQTIAQYMNESRMIYVIVGDGETQATRLAGLGYGKPVALSIHGEPLEHTRRVAGPSAEGSSQN